MEMQRRPGVDVQALDQVVGQEAGGLVQGLRGLLGVPHQDAEEHLGVRVVRRHLHGVDRHHPHPRVLQLARDDLRQVALDLVGDLEAAVGGG